MTASILLFGCAYYHASFDCFHNIGYALWRIAKETINNWESYVELPLLTRLPMARRQHRGVKSPKL